MKNIFVYGSLMFDDVWKRVVQCQYEKRDAVLFGHRRLPVMGEHYPGLVKSSDHSVEGVIYLDVNAQDIDRLDRFEGDDYKKISVTVSSGADQELDAEAYLFDGGKLNLLRDTDWDPVRFEIFHLRQFITRYT